MNLASCTLNDRKYGNEKKKKKDFSELVVGHFIALAYLWEFSCLNVQMIKVPQALLVLKLKIYFVL